MWPSQGVQIFAVMAFAPPFIAALRGNFVTFAETLLVSIFAYVCSNYTALVPLAVILLVAAFILSVRKTHSNSRVFRFVRLAFLLGSVIAVGMYVLRLSLLYNWRPAKIIEEAFVSPRATDMDLALTKAISSKFPIGTDERSLKSLLMAQGFEDVVDPRPFCRVRSTTQGWTQYRSCPPGSREMRYSFETFDLICGTRRVSVNWSVDADGRLARIEATDQTRCL